MFIPQIKLKFRVDTFELTGPGRPAILEEFSIVLIEVH